MDWLTTVKYGNEIWKWLAAGGTIVLGFILMLALKRVIASILGRLASKTETEVDDLLVHLINDKTKSILLLVFAILFGSLFLKLPESLEQVIYKATLVAVLLQAAFWGSGILRHWLARVFRKDDEKVDPAIASAQGAVTFLSNTALWAIIILAILHNLGVNITTFVAGLGVGGIAIALAIQNILGDLFASLSIVIDRPFVVGDYIVVGDMMGTVEKIGVKTTRVRSLSGEQLIFANTDLLKSRIRNYKQMFERRIVFQIGVTYETPQEKLAKITDMMREIMESLDDNRCDRVHFASFGDSALIFEMAYYVTKPDYSVYMEIQQNFNFELLKRFAKEGIEFAYPTQTLFVNELKQAS